MWQAEPTRFTLRSAHVVKRIENDRLGALPLPPLGFFVVVIWFALLCFEILRLGMLSLPLSAFLTIIYTFSLK